MAGSTNKAAVPEAKGALDRFKYEVASEIGVPLTDGYNGDLTSRQNMKRTGKRYGIRLYRFLFYLNGNPVLDKSSVMTIINAVKCK